jgi:hypothetical protein
MSDSGKARSAGAASVELLVSGALNRGGVARVTSATRIELNGVAGTDRAHG